MASVEETAPTSKEKKQVAAEMKRMDAAQDPDLPKPPDDAKTYERGKWLDLPPKKLLEIVAYSNCGNWTGDLDWCKRGTQLSKPLVAMTTGFCDNIVLRCLVPPEQIKLGKDGDCRTQEYTHFGERCKTIREIVARAGITIPPDHVTGARLFAVSKQSVGSVGRRIPAAEFIDANTVIGRGKDAAPVPSDGWYWQHFKVTLCDADLQTVIDMVRSGAFAHHGLWLNDFDITIDCAGVVRVKELIPWLLKNGGGFWMEGKQVDSRPDEWDSDGRPVSEASKKIMDNAHKVGNNCITWVQRCKGMFVRVKAYIKLVQEFEKQSVRSTVGNHISDWNEMDGTLLAKARDDTAEVGLMRSETTIYVDCDGIPIQDAHLYIPETAELMTAFAELQIAVIPSELVLEVPHRVMVSNWCANIVHTLVVVDIYYDTALVCYAKNEVTHTVSGVYVAGWHRRGKYVLQKLMLGEHPVDVIYICRGSKHEPIRQELPGEDHSSKKLKKDVRAKLSKAEKARAKEDDATFLWIDADADLGNGQMDIKDCFKSGDKRPAEAEDLEETEMEDAEEDAEEEEEEEQLDTEAQVAVARAEERARVTAELQAAQAAAQTDTTSTLAPGETMRVAADPGALVAFVRRYHRVPIKAEDVCVTEFPPSGGLDHSFCIPDDHPNMPKLLPINDNARTAEQKRKNKENKEANIENVNAALRAMVEGQLTISGFRPVDQMNTVHVHPRVGEAPPVSNKIKQAWLVEASHTLELDMNSIAGATKRSSFALKPATRKRRKEKLLLHRQELRLANVAAAAAERPEIVRQKRCTSSAIELKTHLRSLYTAKEARAMRWLEPGTYPIVAVRVHESEDKDSCYDIFLQTSGMEPDTEVTIEPYKWTDAINKAFNANALVLAPWYNSLGNDATDKPRHGVYYMNPDRTTAPIGTFTKSDTMLTASNGKQRIDCGITIGEHVLLRTAAQERERHATAETPQEMETESPSNTPPPLLVTEELKRSSSYIAQAFPVAKNGAPRALSVCKMAITDYYGHKGKVMLEVKESDGKAVIAWGGVTINNRAAEITRDCFIVVRKVLARNDVAVDIVDKDAFDFTYTLPKYSDIPAIRKGNVSGQPTEITISAVGSVKVDKAYNPVILDSEGKAWRFAAPQNIKPNKEKKQAGLALRKGAVLDTVKMVISTTE